MAGFCPAFAQEIEASYYVEQPDAWGPGGGLA